MSKFCIEEGKIIRYYESDLHNRKQYDCGIKWFKPKQFSNSLKGIIQQYNSIDKTYFRYRISRLINGKYTSGFVCIFPDGTYAWIPKFYTYNNEECIWSNSYNVINIPKYWEYIIWGWDGIIVSDPKFTIQGIYFNVDLYLSEDLYTESTKGVVNKITDFPPIYGKCFKINPLSYIEKSDKWDDIINSTWYKPIDEFIKEFNVDEEDDDWKDLLRRANTSPPSREWILEQKVKKLEKELKDIKACAETSMKN